MIEIRHKTSGVVLQLVEAETLRGANLSGAGLHGADLCRAGLSDADLHGANLSDADLSGADLSGAGLHGADLSRAGLSDANLSYANLSYANLSYANLRGADLRGADLSDTATVPFGGGSYHGCVTPTELFVGCVRLALDAIPADDDEAAWDALHEMAWDWWSRYGGMVRAAIDAVADEREAVMARVEADDNPDDEGN